MSLLRRFLSFLRPVRRLAPVPSGAGGFLELSIQERRLVVLCCARTSAAPAILELIATPRRPALLEAARGFLALPSSQRIAVLHRLQTATVLHEVALLRVTEALRGTPVWWQQLVADELPSDVRALLWRALERSPPSSLPNPFALGPHPALRTLAARFVQSCLSTTSVLEV